MRAGRTPWRNANQMRNHHRNKYTIKNIETISARNHIKDHKRQKLVKHPELWKAVVFLENGTIESRDGSSLFVWNCSPWKRHKINKI